MNKLSIVIVNFNSGEFLLRCVKSLDQVKDEMNFEIWIVDNASDDQSLKITQKQYPKLNYVLSSQNLGFAKANNLVLKKIKTEFILVLNPDTEVQAGVLKTMVNFMEQNPEVGAATCKVLLDNGNLDWATHRGFPTPLASLLYFLGDDRLYHLSNQDLGSVHEVDAISGAFFLTRKKILDQVGYFDEAYFMYAEDIDLCFRIKQAGFKVMYVPQVKITHFKGITSGLKKHSQKTTLATLETRTRSLSAFYQTMKIFYKKHYERNNLFLVNWLVYLGINLRWWWARKKLMV